MDSVGCGAVSDCGDAVNPSLGAWPRHPCRGHPALRHRPTSDRTPRLLAGVDLGRHFCQISKSIWGQIRFPPENGSDPKSRSNTPQETVEGGVGAGGGREHPGWRDRASMDGFTASPATGPTPPTYRNPAVAVAVAVAVASSRCRAASPAEHHPYFKRSSRLPPAHTTANHATPCHPHCASARLPSAPPAAMPMNMPVNSNALRRLRAGGTRP